MGYEVFTPKNLISMSLKKYNNKYSSKTLKNNIHLLIKPIKKLLKMKKLIPAIAALALVLSVVSCKETTTEKTIETEEVYEAPSENIESPAIIDIDTTMVDTVTVDSITVQ